MFGPDQRATFEADAVALYEELVAHAGLAVDDERTRSDAFALLREVGLVTSDPSQDRWEPVDPALVQSRVVTPLGQQGAELIAESAHWARTFAGLTQTWRRSPATLQGPFAELRGEAISTYIGSVVADADEELLTAQPQANRATKQLAASIEPEVNALRRGVTVRTLYQHAARRSVATRDYVAAVAAEGAQVRTLDEFFGRLIVVDRRVAIIPGAEAGVAVSVREPSVVAYLADIFERSWQRARPFTRRDASDAHEIAAEQRAMTIRMLISGSADPGSAARLGVSQRTYAGYVAELKAEFEAETRFQLGYELGRRGITGRDATGS